MSFDHGGGIAILDVPDEAAAIDFIETDPAVVAGVLTYILHHLTAYFDKFNSTRTDERTGVDDLATRRRNAPQSGSG